MSKASAKQEAMMQARREVAQWVGERIARDRYTGKPELAFVIRSVAPSGMSRVFSVAVACNDKAPFEGIVTLDRLIAEAFGYRLVDSGGFRVNGCGMDMRFAVCDDIARLCEIPGIKSGNDIGYVTL